MSYSDAAREVKAITTSDTVDNIYDSLLATASGNVHITTLQGSDVTLPIVAGVVLRISCQRVFTTGTTATGLFGLVY